MDSENIKRPWWTWSWYVILIPVVFPLFLYANNLGQATLDNLWRPILFSALFSVVVFGVFFMIRRDRDKAGLATVIIDIAVFSYGHIYNLIEKATLFGVMIGRHRYLLLVVAFFVAGLLWLIMFRLKNRREVIKAVSILALIFFTFQAGQITYFEISSYLIEKKARGSAAIENPISDDIEKRDVYLIVLDEYMRSDYLLDTYNYDNSNFLKQLEDLGFYVVPCSRSNYAYTIQSMTSEMNMDYLENLNVNYNDNDLSERFKHSEVREIFNSLGYEFVFFQPGYPYINIDDADRYIKTTVEEDFSDFELLYLETTIAGYPFEYYQKNIVKTYDEETTNRLNRINSVIRGLQNPIESDSPLFVYAHILSPHNPKFFTEQGEINLDWESDMNTAISGTYSYIEKEIILALEFILSNSEQEPIIILQSDHGDTYVEGYRNLNLNAYYLPDGGEVELYPTITPVNTFRLIFSEYLGMDYPLLPDNVFASPEGSRYDFTQVEDPYENCAVQSD